MDINRMLMFAGPYLPAYRKRMCHRHLDRRYQFKAVEKRERQRVLFTGLNQDSRRLLRRMKGCTVTVDRLDVANVGLPIIDTIAIGACGIIKSHDT